MPDKSRFGNSTRYTGEPRVEETWGDKVSERLKSIGSKIYGAAQNMKRTPYGSDYKRNFEDLEESDQKLLEPENKE
jgi:hypothetical protein